MAADHSGVGEARHRLHVGSRRGEHDGEDDAEDV